MDWTEQERQLFTAFAEKWGVPVSAVEQLFQNVQGLGPGAGEREHAALNEESDAPENETGLDILEAERLLELGLVCSDQGDHSEALAVMEKAIEIFLKAGDRPGEAKASAGLAMVYQIRGDLDRAVELHGHAVAIHQETGNRRFEGIAMGNLATACQAKGDIDQAIRLLEQVLIIHQDVGDKGSEGIARGNLAIAYKIKGEYEMARREYERALVIRQEMGDRRGEGIVLGNLGDTLCAMEQWDEAESAFRQAMSICDDALIAASGAFRGSLALLLARQGTRTGEVFDLIRTGETQVEAMPIEHAKFLCKKGEVCLLSGARGDAIGSLEAARKLATELQVSGDSEVGQAIEELEALLSG